MTKSDARKSPLTSRSAAVLRAIAASISGRHASPPRSDVSAHSRSRRVRSSGLRSTVNRCTQAASAWL